MDGFVQQQPELVRSQWKLARKRAIASKDPICAICHTEIDLEAPAFSPNAVEVDHIVPRSRGGALYDIENLQLTHSKCNRQKGSKMDSDYEYDQNSKPVPLSNNW